MTNAEWVDYFLAKGEPLHRARFMAAAKAVDLPPITERARRLVDRSDLEARERQWGDAVLPDDG